MLTAFPKWLICCHRIGKLFLLQVSGLMSFKKEEADPLVQQALEAVDDMNNALALCKDVRTSLAIICTQADEMAVCCQQLRWDLPCSSPAASDLPEIENSPVP